MLEPRSTYIKTQERLFIDFVTVLHEESVIYLNWACGDYEQSANLVWKF